MRPIDADKLVEELEKWDWQDVYLPSHFKELLIDEAPTMEVEPVVHAHWEMDEQGDCKCSRCGEWRSIPESRCPECGAHMDEEVKNE